MRHVRRTIVFSDTLLLRRFLKSMALRISPLHGFVLSAVVLIFSWLSSANGEQNRPNIVLFMVDDLGVADLGCFGNDSLKTPNIDKLASQGARLTHNLAGESICTPSRAAFLTGRYAVRSGMVPSEDTVPNIRVFLSTALPGGLPRNEMTFATALRGVGYKTGLIGKWHLGLNQDKADDFFYHPLKHGFDYFYGIPLTNTRNCQAGVSILDHTFPEWKTKATGTILAIALLELLAVLLGKLRKIWFVVLIFIQVLPVLFVYLFDNSLQAWNCILMRNYEIVEQPMILENLTARFTSEAVDFIEQDQAKPFLLFMSYAKVHAPLFTTKAFEGHSGHSKYGDNVEEMDWSVGQIMNAIDHLGIRENTFVYFTSDHGPHLEQIVHGEYQGGWKGILKGGKGQSWEGGIRVPAIASWPTHIPSGIEIKEPTTDLNVFPTVLKVAGAGLPGDRIIDGQDMMPLLKQQVDYFPNEFMFHYCAKAIHAVRYRPRHGTTTWKAHFTTPKWVQGTQTCFGSGICGCYGNDVTQHDLPLLYDVTNDPGEMNPIDPSNQQYKDIIQQMKAAVSKHQKDVKPVPPQLDVVLWRPWLQSCCNYPYCQCTENFTRMTHSPPSK